jgi:S-adenosylmethionine synthetase
VRVNTEDVPERGEMFLTVSGTSAEAGDDGEVGRGNRANGLITPYRPMTLEAAAGKNPVNHVGKLYNIAAREIAETVVRELPGAKDAACVLVSRIGEPIDQPQAVDLELGVGSALNLEKLSSRAVEVTDICLRNLPALQMRLLEGSIEVF